MPSRSLPQAANTIGLVVILVAACFPGSPGAEDELELANHVPVGCHAAIDPEGADHVEDLDPLASGQPVYGIVRVGMPAMEADTHLLRLGVCYSFRYQYTYNDEPTSGYSEVWCMPPPGVVSRLRYTSRGAIVVFVNGLAQNSPRPQPTLGWGC